jgi:hypothetical protein
MLWRPNRSKTKPLGSGGDGSHPFGINSRSDADGEISDLHGFLHIGASASAMRRSTALIAFDAV